MSERRMPSELITNGCREFSITLLMNKTAAKLVIINSIRQVDLSDEGRIWRDFAFGDLLDIIALDTRK